MKKFFTLIAVALLAFAAQAEVLTVCDGTQEDYGYPVFASEMSAGRFTQTIYPASMLADMQGDKISQVKYYTNSEGLSFSGNFELSFKIVDQDGFVLISDTIALIDLRSDIKELVLGIAGYVHGTGNLSYSLLGKT